MTFSVIITVYNKAEFIKNTIISVLNQSFQDFEIIIINDGSTDRSIHEIQQITNPKIRLFTTKNNGVSHARNFGIKQATGTYIAFLDGDDLWVDNHLYEISNSIKLFPKQHIYANALTHLIGHKKISCSYSIPNKRILVIDYFKGSKQNSLLHPSTIVISKEALNKIGNFNINYSNAEDTEYWFRLGLKYKVVFNTKHTVIRNFTHNSLSQKQFNPKNFCFFEQFDEFRNTNPDLSIFLNRNLYSLALSCKINGFTKELTSLKKRIDYKLLNTFQKIILFSPSWALTTGLFFKNKIEKLGLKLKVI